MAKTNSNFEKYYPHILVGGSVVGLVASFILTLEKLALLKDPSHQLSCSLNPVLSCGNIILSPQASAFGFPNPWIGLFGFGVVITVGMALLAKAKFERWFWLGLQAGATFGFAFVHWLIYESLYEIGALCIYCMFVWSITAPIFWYTTLINLNSGRIKTPKALKKAVAFANQHHLDILVAWYVLVIALILKRFWDYWSTLI